MCIYINHLITFLNLYQQLEEQVEAGGGGYANTTYLGKKGQDGQIRGTAGGSGGSGWTTTGALAQGGARRSWNFVCRRWSGWKRS